MYNEGIALSHIDRYAQPSFEELNEDDEPPTGACWNCGHSVEVKIGNLYYLLEVSERDENGDGDVWECDPDMRDCKDWCER